MKHLDLDSKAFYDWAVKKLADETRLEELQDFAERFPSDELKHIYGALDAEVIPVLARTGIPITREELRVMFLAWFVRRASPVMQRGQESPGDATLPDLRPT